MARSGFGGGQNGVHALVVAQHPCGGEPDGVQVFAQLIKGVGSSAFGGDEHIDGKERAGNGGGVGGVHENIPNENPAFAGHGANRVSEQSAVLFAGVLVDDGTQPNEVGAHGQGVCVEIAWRECHPGAEGGVFDAVFG